MNDVVVRKILQNLHSIYQSIINAKDRDVEQTTGNNKNDKIKRTRKPVEAVSEFLVNAQAYGKAGDTK
jgi:hypothetical protein